MKKIIVRHRLVEEDQNVQQNQQQPQQPAQQQNNQQPQQQQPQQQPQQQNNQQPQQQSQQQNNQNQQSTDITGTINTYLISMFGNIQNDLKTNFVKQVPAVSEAFKNPQSPLNQAAKMLNDSFTKFTNIQGLKPEDAQGIGNVIEAFSAFLSQLTDFSKQASQQQSQQQNNQQGQQPQQQPNQQAAQQQPQQQNNQQAQQPQQTQESVKLSFGEILNENLKYAQFGEMFADITTRFNNL